MWHVEGDDKNAPHQPPERTYHRDSEVASHLSLRSVCLWATLCGYFARRACNCDKRRARFCNCEDCRADKTFFLLIFDE
jgi:hypothetical protein